MQQTLSIALIIVALFATYTLPAKALNGNTCTVEYLSRGTYITQTAGKAGTINAYDQRGEFERGKESQPTLVVG